MIELADANGLMRLMTAEKGQETPMDKYIRFKNNIDLWYKEMDAYGLTPEEQNFVKKYAAINYGLLPNQENFMELVQAPEIGGFNLLWADRLRKSIAKKSVKDYLILQDEFFENMKDKKLSSKLCHYVWDKLIAMNKGSNTGSLIW